mgnify:FL=1
MFYSLKNRLIASFAVLLFVSFAVSSSLLFNESRSIIRSYIESSALEKMDEYGSFIHMASLQLYDLASIVFNSDITRKWDTAMSDPKLPAGEKLLADISLSQFLTRTTNSYSGISSVAIYRQDGFWVSTDNEVVADRSFLDADWYRDFKTQGIHWVPAHRDPVETRRSRPYPVVSLLLPIGVFEPSLSRSVMKVNVSADFLLEPLNRIHLGKHGTVYLLDETGRPMLTPSAYRVSPQASAQIAAIRASSSRQGVVYLRDRGGASDILVYKKLDRSNWMLVGLVSEKDLFANLFALRTTIIALTSALLLAAIVLATWLSYGIAKPLSRLAGAMRSVQDGDFALAVRRLPPRHSVRNEVGFVTETFRNMVERLQAHIQTEFELKLLRQQAEYRALLMQINPHFLFNTLELMTSLAIQRRTNDSVRIIESLGRMLRFSLRAHHDLIPLAEELDYVRHYLSILQIRFGDKLQAAIEVEGDASRLEVIKFILQPLIENAVKYSFRNGARAEVRIGVRREGGQVRLSVSDSGPGMPPDLAQRLVTESVPQQFDQVLGGGFRQIGLRNVLVRCRLYYGPRFKFEIDSAEGRGTRIELILPAQEGNEDVSRADCG